MKLLWAFALSSLFVHAEGVNDAIKACEMQMLYVQKMTREFLLVAYPINASENKIAMTATIGLFTTTLAHLQSGNTAASIPVPPSTFVAAELVKLNTVWAAYKTYLTANVDAANSSAFTTAACVTAACNTTKTARAAMFVAIDSHSQLVMGSSALVLAKYNAYAKLKGVTVSPTSETFARGQLMQMQKVMKEALFISLNVKKAAYIKDMDITTKILHDVHTSLLSGNNVAHVKELKKVCTLHAITVVSKALDVFDQLLRTIHEVHGVSKTVLLALLPASAGVDAAMAAALVLIVNDPGTCNLVSSINDEGWFNLLAETAHMRYLSQKVTRIYLQIAKHVDVAHHQVQLLYTLSDADDSLIKLLKGSHKLNIPAPVTQAIKNNLMLAQAHFKVFGADVKASSAADDFSQAYVYKIEAESKNILDEMRSIANMCVVAAMAAKPKLNNLVWEVSERQLTLLEKMSKEALLVVLGQHVKTNKAEFALTVRAFEGSHQELLNGRIANASARRLSAASSVLEVQAFKKKPLPRTQDACTLTEMATVEARYTALKALLTKLMDSNKTYGYTTEAEIFAAVSKIDSLTASATVAMESAVAFYHSGHGKCSTTLSVSAWEVSIQQSGRMEYQLQKAVTEYYLIAGGLAKIWLDRATGYLKEHEGFITENAAEKQLPEAFKAFKTTWDAYSSTDEQTSLALQVAYITLNIHPAGEKDKLDFAVSPQQYHTVHGQYHPIYRAILYDKNYYDIFMLDLKGNLIYSVYKEADYATNFAAAGSGRWKNSGLGEAFEASMAKPDIISIIDWKPYGPSAGALASFLSTGIREPKVVNGEHPVIGVYCTQMPPDSKPINSQIMMNGAIADIDALLKDFKFGDSTAMISPPPQQAIANSLFALNDVWAQVHARLDVTATTAGLNAVENLDAALTAASAAFVGSFVQGAWTAAPTLQGAKVSIAASQEAVLQGIMKQVVLIHLAHVNASRPVLKSEILRYEANYKLLLEGNASSTRRLQTFGGVPQMTDVKQSTDAAAVSLLEAANKAWIAEGGLKEKLTKIGNGGSAAELVVRDVVTLAGDLIAANNKVFTFFSSTTLTTTLMALEILAPMPFTGSWAAGATMKVASLLAEGLINEQQMILPNYHIKSVFFDDKCDSVESSRIVLREMSVKDTYIALGGAGCSDVCARTAFVAQTIRLPFVSYECPSAALSDVAEYPDLTRFGTVTLAAVNVIKRLGDNYTWPKITIISGDLSKWGPEAQAMQAKFTENGFATEYVYAFDDNFDAITGMMANLMGGSAGEKRIYYLVGTEDYFRKVLCASILSGAKPGITWLSQGTFRDEWWKRSDSEGGFHRKWLNEDAAGAELAETFSAFSAAWDSFAATDELRRAGLYALYRTELLDQLDVPVDAGDEQYHVVHQKWHPSLRTRLYTRGYYDIFMHDLRGNCIYSVYKESDYATNFALKREPDEGTITIREPEGTVPPLGVWADSGLGDAYRAGLKAPNNVSYIDWKPYGPSAGALAAFLSTGIRDKEGILIGVYTIQLPPTYVRSIEETEPECSIPAMTQAFEGAINIAGLGRPSEEDIVKPLPCFDGHSARSFLEMLDRHLAGGYPLGDRATQVEDPYGEVKAHAADAVCVLAMTVRDLLAKGKTIAQIQRPDATLYAEILKHVKTGIDFQGASGRVKFDGNDKPNYLVVKQVQSGKAVEVGLVSPYNGSGKASIEWTNGGAIATAWTSEVAVVETEFPWIVFQVGIPVLICVVAIVAACINGCRRDVSSSSDGQPSLLRDAAATAD